MVTTGEASLFVALGSLVASGAYVGAEELALLTQVDLTMSMLEFISNIVVLVSF